MDEIRTIVRMHREYGIKAVTAFPSGLCPQVPIDDRKWYPIYAKCVAGIVRNAPNCWDEPRPKNLTELEKLARGSPLFKAG